MVIVWVLLAETQSTPLLILYIYIYIYIRIYTYIYIYIYIRIYTYIYIYNVSYLLFRTCRGEAAEASRSVVSDPEGVVTCAAGLGYCIAV